MEQQKKGAAIGIDLGSAYTRVAVYDGSNCRMIPDQHGNYAMPSYVAFTASGVLVGEAARSQAPQNPANTIFDVIRLIGRRYSDPLILRSKMLLWPFKVRAGPGDRLLVDVQWKRKLWHFTPVEICSMILMQIKENAEINLGATITDAVITVPGHYNYEQRQAIKQAGMIAGLNFMKIITSPAASAYFYSTERLSKSSSMVTNITRNIFNTEPKEYNMIIFDLGAGTLDVSLVSIKNGECKVQAAAGDLHLGGTDFDNNMVDHFVDLLNKRGIKRINNISMAMCNLRTSCEKAKISLSSGNVWVPLKITPLYDNVNFESSITNAEFEELNNEPLLKCIRIIDTCLTDAKISINEVHEVILAGGSARIPRLQFSVRRYFKRKELNVSQNLETATAYGAAFQAFFLATRGMGRVTQLSLFDVIPFPLGFQSFQGEMVVCIPKNTAIPTKIEKTFRSFHSDRKSFLFEVYEGEDTLTNQDYLLGKFELCTTHISPNGSDINVCFEIDENGTLIVTAEELSSGMRNNITITSHNIEDSQRRVWEALLYNEGEKGINKASTNKSSAQTDPSTICIGIDFGTTYSCVAVWQQNDVKIIENEYMSCVTRSAVSFTETGRFIGDSAITEEVLTSPESTLSNIKRLIGTWYSDQSLENVRGVVRGKNNRAMVSVRYKGENKKIALEEIASMILSKMKEIAEAHVSSKITHAVISIPACFRDSQRKAIQDAAVIAGLNVMQLLNETTAAAIAYFVKKVGGGTCGEKTLLVFDLGGGYLDVSIVTISESIIKVQAVVSDTNLGGEDFDNNMVIHFVAKFLQEKKRDISNKARSLRRLRAACEKAKKILSRYTKTTIEIDAFDDGIDFSTAITREFFEKLNMSLFLRCIEGVKKCLRDAKLDKSCIDEVVLVGGSARIPKVQRLLQEFFNGKELCKSLDLDETVAYGAAVRAAILCGNKDIKKLSGLKVQDVTSCSFWLEGLSGAMNLLIPKSTPIPTKKELLFSTCLDNLTSITLKIHDCDFASSTVFTLSGILPKHRGNSKINVSVEVDHNGILDLTAIDMSSMWRNEIEICKENEGLTKEEVQKMVEAAACYKAEDEAAKARAAALNSLENFAYKLKAMARDGGVSGSSKKLVEEAAQGAIGWLEKNYNASIDEIIAWNKHLETIKSRIVYLGTPARAQ